MAIRKPVIGIPEGGPHTALGEIPDADTLDPNSIPAGGGPFPGTGLEVPTLLDAVDRAWGAGKLTGLDMTDAGGGLVDISAGEAIFRNAASRTAPLENLPVPGVVGQALTDNMVNWVYADYNAGTPQVLVTTNEAIINELDLITLGMVYRTGTAVAFANIDDEIVDAIDRIRQLFEDVNGNQRVVGSSLISDPTPSSLKVAVTSGTYYLGLTKINHPAFDTSVADTFTYWHRDGVGGWTSTLIQTDIDNGFFDDGTGVLAALGANRFNNAWVYLQIADNISSIHVVYGRDNSPNFQGADGANVPGDIPPALVDIGVFIGRWIIQQGVGIPAAIDSAFEQVFSTSAVADHNSLAGIQGGLPAERNHLSNAELASLLAHLLDTANPHSVTIGQIGAEAANANIQAHVAGPVTGNPHAVTFTESVTADVGTDITAAEAETLTDGSNADLLHAHAPIAGADHGGLAGLADDDHLQYLTEVRHDALPADNPHSVTAAQAGAEPANVNIQAHIADVLTNPHAVTAAQAGAEPANANIQAHIASTANPHGTTFTQAVTADAGTNITAAEAETLTDGSNADALHVHAVASAFALAALQIRKTDATAIGTVWADILFNNTDIENEAATIEHNNTNTDDIDFKVAGHYLVEYHVNIVHAGAANSNMLLQGRVRLNDAGTGVAGSHNETSEVDDNSIEGTEVETILSAAFIFNAAASDKLTLQLQYVDIGAGTPAINNQESTIKVVQLFRA